MRIRKIVTILSVALAAPLLGAAAARAATVVRIDAARDHGVWEGWGTSLAWMGKSFGDRDDIADLFFTGKTVEIAGQKLPGLRLNIVRYNAGASSWNTLADGRRMVVSPNILPFRQIEGYWLDPRDPDPASAAWDWSVDTAQRRMLLAARDRGADRFELFSNSPMWWMTRNDNPSGAADGGDNIHPDRYADFAHYLAAIAHRARDRWGVTFHTVAAFNEPSADWWKADNKQESTHVSRPEQAKILPLVRAALDAQGLRDVALSASDESYTDQAIETWRAFAPATRALVDQVNVHGYQGTNGRRDILHALVRADDKRLWNSEHGDKDGYGLELAENLHLDFFHLHPTAWAYWQPIDGGRLDLGGSGWGLLDARMGEKTILKANPKYHVLAQYSRHIRPGMTIHLGDHPRVVFAVDRARKKVVVVAFNPRESAEDHVFDLAPLGAKLRVAGAWLTRPKDGVYYDKNTPDIRTRLATVRATLPPRSIQTIELAYRRF